MSSQLCGFLLLITLRKGEIAIISHDTLNISSPEELKDFVIASLDEDKTSDIVAIPLNNDCALADYMIIASGTSSRHVLSSVEKLKDRLNVRGYKDIKIEGAENADWVILDIGDIIVHVFRPEVRSFYNIEKMWAPSSHFNIVDSPQTA